MLNKITKNITHSIFIVQSCAGLIGLGLGLGLVKHVKHLEQSQPTNHGVIIDIRSVDHTNIQNTASAYLSLGPGPIS